MGINCAGEHECSPPHDPKPALGDTWCCPDCLQSWNTQLFTDNPLYERMHEIHLRHGVDDSNLISWTTRARL